MKTYLISYDLDKPGQDYKDLIDRLRQLGAIKVLYSEWVLQTPASAVQVRDDLDRFMDANDRILVVALTGESAWRNLMISSENFKSSLAA